ncbi:MAG: hypothetical protein HFI76_10620 [Lachnospiraceae bacterium]|nr:hypothetical protein [Lachnospiraceae bacterium]
MEEKAINLLNKLQETCIKYHYWKIDNILKDAQDMSGEIQDFCGAFLKGNIWRMEEGEYQLLQAYTLQVLEDYVGALQHQDTVWMLDTLDAGLRELLMLFIDEKDMGEYTYGK